MLKNSHKNIHEGVFCNLVSFKPSQRVENCFSRYFLKISGYLFTNPKQLLDMSGKCFVEEMAKKIRKTPKHRVIRSGVHF